MNISNDLSNCFAIIHITAGDLALSELFFFSKSAASIGIKTVAIAAIGKHYRLIFGGNIFLSKPHLLLRDEAKSLLDSIFKATSEQWMSFKLELIRVFENMLEQSSCTGISKNEY
jgi:hypothetical protein